MSALLFQGQTLGHMLGQTVHSSALNAAGKSQTPPSQASCRGLPTAGAWAARAARAPARTWALAARRAAAPQALAARGAGAASCSSGTQRHSVCSCGRAQARRRASAGDSRGPSAPRCTPAAQGPCWQPLPCSPEPPTPHPHSPQYPGRPAHLVQLGQEGVPGGGGDGGHEDGVVLLPPLAAPAGPGARRCWGLRGFWGALEAAGPRAEQQPRPLPRGPGAGRLLLRRAPDAAGPRAARRPRSSAVPAHLVR
jgi:hypothetical protein